MAGLDPAIQLFFSVGWMAGSRAGHELIHRRESLWWKTGLRSDSANAVKCSAGLSSPATRVLAALEASMTTAILAAIIPLSVNFLLAAAVFRLPELQAVPNGFQPAPDLGPEMKAVEPVAAEAIEETEVAEEVTKQAA
jgi:hypothetical protein